MTTTIKSIPVKDITVDHRYQRPLDKKRVEKMAEGFDPHLFGTLEVSARKSGRSTKYIAFEGQHRLALAKAVGLKTVDCIVHGGLEAIDEAKLFVRLHTERKSITPIDRFNARVFAGEPTALAVKAAINDAGCEVGEGKGESTISAITAAEKAWRLYGDTMFREALGIIGQIWSTEPNAYSGGMVQGMTRFVAQYGERIDQSHLAKLEKCGPQKIIDAARDVRHRSTLALAVTIELKRRTCITGVPRRVGVAS
jgi:hypothetical protein